MSFQCQLCHATYLLDTEDLVNHLPCNCMICKECADAHLASQVQRHMSTVQQQGPSQQQSSSNLAQLVKGCNVLYHDKAAGLWVDADITHVDLSVDPPQFGIHIASREAGTSKYTESTRLVPRDQQIRPQGEYKRYMPSPPPQCVKVTATSLLSDTP